MDAAVRLSGVRKRFGHTVALDGLDVTIPAGTLTGFLGPNGAGKTTTFRILMGLTRADAGEIEVLGRPVGAGTPTIVKRVGAVVEEPGLYKTLTATDNLRVAALTLGAGDDEIPDLLDFVGLTGDAGRKVDGFSRGMRQRLALAAALLGDPEMLVLDEPLDGLDPAGQVSFKGRLRSLVDDRGKTVVVSSHDLRDIEQLADHVLVIDHGRRVASGSVAELAGDAGRVRVTVSDPVRGGKVLREAGFAVTAHGEDLDVADGDGSAIARALADAGLYPSALVPLHASLEEVFLRLTSGGAS